MGWFAFIGVVIALITGVPVMWRGDIWLGLCGILAPFIALCAGGSLTGALRIPGYPKLVAFAISGAMLGAASYWAHVMGWSVTLWGLHLSGLVECLAMFALGLLFGSSERANPMRTNA